MFMASTILVGPDGTKEERKVITNLEVNDLKIIAFDMGSELNGNHCTHVSYLSPEGRYQNIVDEAKWDECKKYLIQALHGEANEYYRPVPSEILVTADPSRELYLRPANYESLVSMYDKYLNGNNLSNETQGVDNSVNMSSTDINQVAPTVEATSAPSIPEPVSMAPSMSADIPMVNNEIKEEIPSIVPEVKVVEEENNIQDMNTITEIPNIMGNDVVVDNSNNEMQGMAPIGMMDTSVMGSEVSPIPTMDNITPIAPVIEQPSIMTAAPVDMTIPVVNDTPVQTDTNIAPVMPAMDNIAPIAQVVEQPSVIPTTPVDMGTPDSSIVTDNYVGTASDIIEKMKQTSIEYSQKIDAISKEFITEMENMKQEMIGHLKEAKEYGNLIKGQYEAHNQNNQVLQRSA